jgi:hypothetical protein
MNIHIFLLLITFVYCQSNDLFSNLAMGGSSSSNTLNQCVEIGNARPCATMPWNMTIFPNLLGHTRAEGKQINFKNTNNLALFFLQKLTMNWHFMFHYLILIVQNL